MGLLMVTSDFKILTAICYIEMDIESKIHMKSD